MDIVQVYAVGDVFLAGADNKKTTWYALTPTLSTNSSGSFNSVKVAPGPSKITGTFAVLVQSSACCLCDAARAASNSVASTMNYRRLLLVRLLVGSAK
jgi:hypothetical protein